MNDLINRLGPIRKQSPPAAVNVRPQPAQQQPTAAIDFDGVLAVFREDHDLSKTKLRDGARRGMQSLRDAGLRLIIWTSRPDPGEVAAWLTTQGVPFDEVNNNSANEVGSRKIAADVYVDDHAVAASKHESWDEIAGEVMEMVVGDPSQPAAEGYDDLAQKAGQAQQELSELLDRLGYPTYAITDLELGQLEEILRQPGGVTLIAPIKAQQRAEEKVTEEYDNDWTRLLDMVRGAVAVDTMEQIQLSIGTLNGLGARYARMPKDYFREPMRNGYRAIHVNYRLPCGMVCEVQYHLKSMLIARERVKLSYDVARAIKASMAEEGRSEMSPAEAEACRRARKAAEHAYALAWEECRRNDPTLVDKCVKRMVGKGLTNNLDVERYTRMPVVVDDGPVNKLKGDDPRTWHAPDTTSLPVSKLEGPQYIGDAPAANLQNKLSERK